MVVVAALDKAVVTRFVASVAVTEDVDETEEGGVAADEFRQ